MRKLATMLAVLIMATVLAACGNTNDNASGNLTIAGASSAQISTIEAIFHELGIYPVSFEMEPLEDEEFFAGVAIYTATDTYGNEFDFIIETERYTIIAISKAHGTGLLYGSLDPFFEIVQANIDKVLGDLDLDVDLNFEGLFGNW